MSKLKTILLCIVVLFAVIGVGAFAVQAMPIQTTPNKTATISVTSNIEGYSIHYAFVDNLQEKTLVDETTELMVGSDYLFYITPPSGYYLTVWGGTFGLTSEDYIPSTTGLGGVIEESAAIEFDLTFKPAVTPTITGENFITTFTNAYGEETNFLVLGQSYSVTFTADENYVLSSATFNGQSIDVTKPFMFTAQETNEFAVNSEKHIKVNVTSNVEGYEILIGDKSALDGFIFNPDSTLRFVAPSGYCFGASGITFDGLGVNLVATTVLTEKYCALSSLSLDEVFELNIILDFVPIISLNVSSENCSIIFKDSLGNVVDEFGQGLVCTLTVIPNEGYVVTESTYNGQEIDVTQPFSFAPSSTINSFVINAEKFINVNVTSNVEGYDILISKDGTRFSALNGFVLPSDSIFFMFFESPSGYCFGKRGISSEVFGATFGFSRVVQSMTSELETSRFDDVVELNIVLSFVPVVSMEISSQDCSTVFTDYSGNVTNKFGVGFEYTLTVTPNEGCVLLGATYNGQAIDATQPFKFTAQEANEFVIDVENNSVEPEPEKSNYYFSNDYVTVSANIPGEFFTYSFRNNGVTFNIDNFSESYVSTGDVLTVKFSSLPGYRIEHIYFNYPVDCSYTPVVFNNYSHNGLSGEDGAKYYPGMTIYLEFGPAPTVSLVLDAPENCEVVAYYRDVTTADGSRWYIEDLENICANEWICFKITGTGFVVATLDGIKYCNNGYYCSPTVNLKPGKDYTLTVESLDTSPYTKNTFNLVNTTVFQLRQIGLDGSYSLVSTSDGLNNTQLFVGQEYALIVFPTSGYAITEVKYNDEVLFSGSDTEGGLFSFVVVENGEFYVATSIITE